MIKILFTALILFKDLFGCCYFLKSNQRNNKEADLKLIIMVSNSLI